jgi:predicted NBD/HSP70 family sugar kinase
MLHRAHDLRRFNERLVVAQLARGTALSRAELAERTGLSAPTVGKVADELIASGLLQEESQPPRTPANNGKNKNPGHASALGRPARPLRLERLTPRFIALQVGVRHTRVAALPVAGPCDEGWAVRFSTPRRATTWLTRLRVAAKQIALRRPWAVTLSLPGVVDEAAGRVLFSPNLRWTAEVDLVQSLRQVWDVPVTAMQEIRALALGHLMAEPTGRDFLLVDFGDGVGAAMVRDGRLYDGPAPLSGELGHTPVRGNARLCGCGSVGCVETLVSRPGLLYSFSASSQGRKPSWPALRRHVQQYGVEPWLADALDAAGTVIAGAMNVTGAKHVIVTGSLTELPASVLDHLHKSVQASAMWARFGLVRLQPAPRRRAAGLIAGALDRVILPAERQRGVA